MSALLLACAVTRAAADDAPATLDLARAIALFHERGFDRLLAVAAVDSADADTTIARAIPNPALSLTYGRSFYTSCPAAGCGGVPNYYSAQISDQAAIEDTLSGKRRLRGNVADAALRAARLSRDDAERTLVFQVKSQFEQVLIAQRALDLARDTAAANAQLLAMTAQQATAGKIGDADVLRVKTVKLESDQAVDQAIQSLARSRADLAFLLGIRDPVGPLVAVEPGLEHYVPSDKLVDAGHDALLARALASRPDLRAQQEQVASAEAQIALQRRQRMPDITLAVGYSQQGEDPSAPSPPTFSIGLSAPLPVLYQQQGEIRKAEAQLHIARITLDKLHAQVVSDFETAYADWLSAGALVRRMEAGELLETARASKAAVIKAHELGALTLLDVLNAVATDIATNVEYETDVQGYWTAVFELEQAVGTDLR